MKKKHLITFSVVLNIIFIALVILGIYFLKTNTDFLGSRGTPYSFQNNSNTQSSEIKLVASDLIVPEQWKSGAFTQTRTMQIPEGKHISVFYAGLNQARQIDFDEKGNLYVADRGNSRIIRITDTNSDGIGDNLVVIDTKLAGVNSVDYHNGDLYIGTTTQVIVYKGITADGKYSKKQILVNDLPDSGHITRTVLVGPDEKLYVAMGSSCNICEEKDQRRAAITRYDLDGTHPELFASGLRNTVGMEFHLDPNTLQYQLWGVDNGRDLLGDDLPPEEVNLIQKGNNYGWPYCYGDQVANPEYSAKSDYCKTKTTKPIVSMQAHSAPLSIAFIPSNSILSQLVDKAVVTFHGSWNRTARTGYKVVYVDVGKPEQHEKDLVTGWLTSPTEAWGRPVDVKFSPSGDMYISDDFAGVIYRVY